MTQAPQQVLQQVTAAPRRSVLHDQPVLLVNQRTEIVELTDEYAVLDGNGVQLGAVVEVGQSAARKVGEIVQATVLGRIRFDVVAGGQLVGAIQAENWRAWDLAVTDAAGVEVARITKTWEGLARTLFTTADRYVVRVHVRLPEPLASLVLASALTVDTALEQDARGLG